MGIRGKAWEEVGRLNVLEAKAKAETRGAEGCVLECSTV